MMTAPLKNDDFLDEDNDGENGKLSVCLRQADKNYCTMFQHPDREIFLRALANWLDSKSQFLRIQNGRVLTPSDCIVDKFGYKYVNFGYNHQYSMELFERITAKGSAEIRKDIKRLVKLLYNDNLKVSQLLRRRTDAAMADANAVFLKKDRRGCGRKKKVNA